LLEHNAGTFPGYTSARRPVVLVHSEYADTLIAAFQRERQLKGWSRRKKEALIAGRTDLLPDLASRPRKAAPKKPPS
jgi:putative endonuclease